MDDLLQLETEVLALLDRNRELAAQEAEARDRAVRAEEACSALQEENQAIRLALEHEKSVRQEAVARIDALMRSIQEHAGRE